MTKSDREKIKAYYNHGEGSRKVRINRDGLVEYYGSTDPTDRNHDYWHCGGDADELLGEIEVMEEWRS